MANSNGFITLNDLQTKFRAAGVYTVYREDDTQPAGRPNTIVRLLPGFSKIGPPNLPVYIEQGDYATAEAIYGKEDKTLERKGSFFHKMLRISLEEGPVLAMNLMKFNNEVDENGVPTANADVVEYRSLSCDVAAANGINRGKLYASYFDKQRFWRPSKSYLMATRHSSDTGALLNFVNISQTPITVIVKKSDMNDTAKGYAITAKEWYGQTDIPAFVRENDYISDYFVDVVIVAGNFGPDKYAQLANDPIFGQYFDAAGLRTSLLSAFLARPEVVTKQVHTGCIIPNFKDKLGQDQFIENIINNQTRQTGLLCAVDRTELDKYEDGTNSRYLDMIGHRLLTNSVSTVDFLSYKRKIVQDFTYAEKANNTSDTFDSNTGYSIVSTPGKITVTLTSGNTDFAAVTNTLNLGAYIIGAVTSAGTTAGVTVAAPVLQVTRIVKTTSQIVFDLKSPLKDAETALSGSFVDIDVTSGAVTFFTENNRLLLDGTDTYYYADINHQIYTDWKNGELTDGDKITNGTLTHYMKFTELYSIGGIDATDDYRKLLMISFYTDADLTTGIATGDAIDFGEAVDSGGYVVASTDVNFISLVGSINRRFDAIMIGPKTARIAIADEPNVKVGQFLVATDVDGNKILTRIIAMRRVGAPATDVDIDTLDPIYQFSNTIGDIQIERYTPITSFFDRYSPTHLAGFKLTAYHLPDGTNAKMKSIQSVMTSTAMYDALIDPEMVDFRYYIDTFNGGLEPQTKRHLTRLIQARQKCLGILNCPSLKEFMDSTNPRFTTTPTAVDPLPELNVEYINQGGNIDENPEFLYTMPDEADGASYVGFFWPNIIVRDSSNDFVSVPPAAYVGNNFMKKYKGGNQFLPVAGPRRGVLTGDGLSRMEYPLTRNDRGALEEKGINPIYQKANGDILIFGNETAQKRIKSVLNNLNTRDTLVTITIDTENILSNYMFEFHNDGLRTEVKTLLDNYLSQLKTGYGAINNYDLVFDKNNNPGFVLRESAAIVDVIIEPADVAKKFIQRITLRKGSAPTLSGFVAV